ncbi:MAG: hypothetical protein EBY62_08030 [Cellvibrionales bacterium]|nr:hypothetical protein [Cellvibrionales bacterium]
MRVFFIGVCGTAMGNAAVLLKKMGHEVAGSDAGVYPPMSDVLESAGIELFEGFAEEEMLTWQPDRVVVGNAVSRGNPQVEYLLRTRRIDFVSLPQLIGEDLIGNRPAVVVAGTHGKTTTTALTSYALSQDGDDPNLLALPDAPWTRIISVGVGEENDFRIVDFTEDGQGTRFKLSWLGATVMEVSWKMPGLFNARNLAMATLASVLSQCIVAGDVSSAEDLNPFASAHLPDFTECAGVKRRQEILHDSEKLVVLSDFAHHPTAIAGALESLRARWPGREIIACFEPRSNTAVTNVFEDRFADALALADVAILGAVHRAEKIPPDQRINTGNMIRRIEGQGKQGHAFLANLDLESFLLEREIAQPSLVVFFSNGSFDGVIGRFADAVKKR